MLGRRASGTTTHNAQPGRINCTLRIIRVLPCISVSLHARSPHHIDATPSSRCTSTVTMSNHWAPGPTTTNITQQMVEYPRVVFNWEIRKAITIKHGTQCKQIHSHNCNCYNVTTTLATKKQTVDHNCRVPPTRQSKPASAKNPCNANTKAFASGKEPFKHDRPHCEYRANRAASMHHWL